METAEIVNKYIEIFDYKNNMIFYISVTDKPDRKGPKESGSCL